MVNLLRWAALAIAVVLGACVELTADSPLFSPTDQAGPPPLTEGIWIALSEDCPERHARTRGRFPEACAPLEIRRGDDGAWRATFRIDLVYGLTAQERADAADDVGPYRIVLAPAVEREVPAESYAPLYLGEMRDETADTSTVGYVAIAPIGVMPATAFAFSGPINCEIILRDGPIEGIDESYTEETTPDGQAMRTMAACTPTTQAAVREAVRRAVIENLDEMLERRFVYVRPS